MAGNTQQLNDRQKGVDKCMYYSIGWTGNEVDLRRE